jgi:hypothetical protein
MKVFIIFAACIAITLALPREIFIFDRHKHLYVYVRFCMLSLF